MKILYIATSFPRPEKGSTIYTDLAEELNNSGHEIIVVVSEEPKNLSTTEISVERKMSVLRVVTGKYYDVNLINKGLTTIKIPYLLKKGIKKYLSNEKFDFILFESPPVSVSSVVKWAKQYFDIPAFLMLKDIFPQNALDIGILNRYNPVLYYFLKKEKELYQIANIIGCMSEKNKEYLINHNHDIDPNKIVIFPNTINIKKVESKDSQHIRRKYNIPSNAKIVLFGGNMGRVQYIDLVVETIINLKDNQDIFFVIVGRGVEKYKIVDAVKLHQINNVLVLNNLPREEYDMINTIADIGLVILDPRSSIPNYPSRILSYLKYNTPVLLACDRSTDINKLIEDANCGKWVYSENSESFINTLVDMANSDNLKELGMNGRKYLEKNLNVKRSVKILEHVFE